MKQSQHEKPFTPLRIFHFRLQLEDCMFQIPTHKNQEHTTYIALGDKECQIQLKCAKQTE